ncbi:hypothetical protein BI364_10055 [Acidihalobacter yilgarnensis]|uniref:Uncharacterized protein n=1 Tax=Acidihalobacter yilgarnensis TaxID=2819280 RepID=A0A1D8IP59_9GAMM|nr:phosphate-starvation-inducible PsiE family protein [Acidihalobacter yilgarnensis]AOU98256.1 hypothetical protein BI364_10055 [Acidihalobacter yilgarnensis]
MVTDVLTSLALIELAWMSATWAMEHALRLAFLLDVCLIFIAREIIDKTYTGHVTPMGAGVLIGVFLALLGGRWLTGKIYRLT